LIYINYKTKMDFFTIMLGAILLIILLLIVVRKFKKKKGKHEDKIYPLW